MEWWKETFYLYRAAIRFTLLSADCNQCKQKYLEIRWPKCKQLFLLWFYLLEITKMYNIISVLSDIHFEFSYWICYVYELSFFVSPIRLCLIEFWVNGYLVICCCDLYSTVACAKSQIIRMFCASNLLHFHILVLISKEKSSLAVN